MESTNTAKEIIIPSSLKEDSLVALLQKENFYQDDFGRIFKHADQLGEHDWIYIITHTKNVGIITAILRSVKCSEEMLACILASFSKFAILKEIAKKENLTKSLAIGVFRSYARSSGSKMAKKEGRRSLLNEIYYNKGGLFVEELIKEGIVTNIFTAQTLYDLYYMSNSHTIKAAIIRQFPTVTTAEKRHLELIFDSICRKQQEDLLIALTVQNVHLKPEEKTRFKWLYKEMKKATE